MNIERPLDLLNSLKGKEVKITSKDLKDQIEATLIAFDIHINLVVEVKNKYKFVRGDSVVLIEPLGKQ